MRTLRASDTINGPSGDKMVRVIFKDPAVAFLLQAEATAPYARASFLPTDMSMSSTNDNETLLLWNLTGELPVLDIEMSE